ncbi:unnamed protein product [Ascophyllum nodosum]
MCNLKVSLATTLFVSSTAYAYLTIIPKPLPLRSEARRQYYHPRKCGQAEDIFKARAVNDKDHDRQYLDVNRGDSGSSRLDFLQQLVRSSSVAAVVYAASTTTEMPASAADSGGNAASQTEAVAAAVIPPAVGESKLASEQSESAASSAVSGLVAGAAVSTSKQLLLHPVDTIKTRLQMRKEGDAEIASPELFSGLYNGVGPPLLAGLPSGAVFFSAKDAFGTAIANAVGDGYADLATVAAVGLAQFPYWGIRTPAELLKTRSQAGVSKEGDGGGLEAAKVIVAEEGVKGLYTGYGSNIVYAFPADAVKFLVYETLKRSAKRAKGGAKLSPVEAAVLGSGATFVAQATTTPLDVVRTRVMSSSASDQPYKGGVPGALVSISREEGFGALWKGTTPRLARSVLSGAIQFGAYEFVKGFFGVVPRKL